MNYPSYPMVQVLFSPEMGIDIVYFEDENTPKETVTVRMNEGFEDSSIEARRVVQIAKTVARQLAAKYNVPTFIPLGSFAALFTEFETILFYIVQVQKRQSNT